MAEEEAEDRGAEALTTDVGAGGHAPQPPSVVDIGIPGGCLGHDDAHGQDGELAPGPVRPPQGGGVGGPGIVLAGIDAVAHGPARAQDLLAQRPGDPGRHELYRDPVVHGPGW